jgi:hypothetical protein
MTILSDGAGNGKRAKVDGNNRLATRSVITSEDEAATKDGRSYNVNTGVITLTNSDDTPVMYVKNNEVQDLHITAIAVGFGASTGGSGMNKVTVLRNPTAGTIIDSTPTNVDISSNRNYGSALTITADAYKGATGDTMTDGEDHLILFQGASGRLFATIDELIPQGKSIGIKIDPLAGNTSMDVYAALICHLEDPNE